MKVGDGMAGREVNHLMGCPDIPTRFTRPSTPRLRVFSAETTICDSGVGFAEWTMHRVMISIYTKHVNMLTLPWTKTMWITIQNLWGKQNLALE